MKFMNYDQNQSMLLPPSLAECLPEDHISFVLSDIVNHMDLFEIEKDYTEDGHPAYHPRMMIKILFYGYIQGVRSSRKLENKTYEDIAFRYLTANARLDHGTINLFRKKHLSELTSVFAQIITVIKGLGLADFSDISLDGTKIKAQASENNLFTKGEIAKFKAKIEAFLFEAEKMDSDEDAKFGDTRGYNQITKRLANPKTRQKEIKKLQKKLADLDKADKVIDQKQEEAKEYDKTLGHQNREKQTRHHLRNKTSNTTDPESNVMKMKNGSFGMAYNVGITAAKRFIAAYDVTNDPSDTRSLPEMIKKTEQNTKQKVKIAKADSTYFNKENITFLKDNQTESFIPDTRMLSDKKKEDKAKESGEIPNKYDRKNFIYDHEHDRFICPEGKYLKLKQSNKYNDGIRGYRGYDCKNCAHLSSCTRGSARYLEVDFKLEEIRNEMRTKLNTYEGKQKYNERIGEVEPVMADIKRNQSFSEFLCRGKKMAVVELGLASSAHNLKMVFNELRRKGIKRRDISWGSLLNTQIT